MMQHAHYARREPELNGISFRPCREVLSRHGSGSATALEVPRVPFAYKKSTRARKISPTTPIVHPSRPVSPSTRYRGRRSALMFARCYRIRCVLRAVSSDRLGNDSDSRGRAMIMEVLPALDRHDFRCQYAWIPCPGVSRRSDQFRRPKSRCPKLIKEGAALLRTGHSREPVARIAAFLGRQPVL